MKCRLILLTIVGFFLGFSVCVCWTAFISPVQIWWSTVLPSTMLFISGHWSSSNHLKLWRTQKLQILLELFVPQVGASRARNVWISDFAVPQVHYEAIQTDINVVGFCRGMEKKSSMHTRLLDIWISIMSTGMLQKFQPVKLWNFALLHSKYGPRISFKPNPRLHVLVLQQGLVTAPVHLCTELPRSCPDLQHTES